MKDIPLIDITDARLGGIEGKKRVADEVRKACENIGFFIVKGHGIDENRIKEAYASFREFMQLPIEVKEACTQKERICPPQRNGYSGLCTENAARFQGVEGQPDDIVEKFSMGLWVLDDSRDDLPFPAGAVGQKLREDIKFYYKACQELSMLITELFAVAAKLPEGFFADKLDNCFDYFRGMAYPAKDPAREGLGFGEHTDLCLFAMLTATEAGLETVNTKGERLMVATDELHHFVINIGDLMERWTNDKWVSNPHRVVLTEKPRDSFVFFKLVNEDVIIETIPNFITEEKPGYPPVSFDEFTTEKAVKLYGTE